MPPKPQKQILKNCLQEPYDLSWPQLEKGVNSFVLSELKRFIQKHPELKKVRSAGKRKQSQEKLEDKDSLRNHIFTGINIITKKLERGSLDLVLVCKSAKPTLLTQHLIPLSVTRSSPAACISGLSSALGSELNLKSVLAFGIFLPENDTELRAVVDSITPKLPKIDIPWLRGLENENQTVDFSENGNRISKPDLEEKNSVDTEKFTLLPTKICINQSIANKKPKKDKNNKN
ncbi:ribonuclease P protein subunit p38-like [Styela clava]